MAYELKQVSVDYKGKRALHEVSCTLTEGKWISVIGQTGAGKSTFVKMLKGLILDYSGEYRVSGRPAPADSKGRGKVVPEIGFVFQYPEHQLFETTVYKELAFTLKLQGRPAREIDEAIAEILPQVGLSRDILPVAPFQLSGGQKRRVALASVLLTDPQLLILDEPTAGLDPLSCKGLLRMLGEWRRKHNRTVLLVSHQMEDVAEYSDEVIVFHEGRLLGHLESNMLFLERTDLLEAAGLHLPEAVALLKLVETLSGHKIEVKSCREQEIMSRLLPVWHSRGNTHGE